jgi:glutamate-ammonia-ligase adenylyltransferase
MMGLVQRARAETYGSANAESAARDLKIGPGGIREVEFFVQSLQLVWGGRDPEIRGQNTLSALRKLRARGLVTDKEGREMAEAYLALRRLEHRVQNATGLQTHVLPDRGDAAMAIARSVGFGSPRELTAELDKTRRRVMTRVAALIHAGGDARPEVEALPDAARLYAALDAGADDGLLGWLSQRTGQAPAPDLARHLLALARRPDAILGAATRDKYPDLPAVLIAAILDAADPEQAARFLATLLGRVGTTGVYAKALAEDPRAARRLVGLFGASAFLGESMTRHPELMDRLLFGSGAPDPASAAGAVDDEVAGLGAAAEDPDEFVGALRRAKGRVLMEVGLADLAGDLSTRACTLALSSLADATLDHACRYALREKGKTGGLAVIAMGKLGGREIGYGSDLDLFFVYDDHGDADPEGAAERYARVAQRILRLVGAPHGDGPGYELDTRLRPSGNQGLLVVSKQAFARYHCAEREDPGGGAQGWERQALVKARLCAGDPSIGGDVLAVARQAAYGRGAPPADRVHHLRTRMERELAGERLGTPGHARYDLKVGRGGLVDIEFAVQWLQMKHGADERVHTTETEGALAALEVSGYLDPVTAASLRDGYRFLRRLEQRLRVLHGGSAQLLEQGAPGLLPLARRMGVRDGPDGPAGAAEALLERYVATTTEVRAAYLAVLGLAG